MLCTAQTNSEWCQNGQKHAFLENNSTCIRILLSLHKSTFFAVLTLCSLSMQSLTCNARLQSQQILLPNLLSIADTWIAVWDRVVVRSFDRIVHACMLVLQGGPLNCLMNVSRLPAAEEALDLLHSGEIIIFWDESPSNRSNIFHKSQELACTHQYWFCVSFSSFKKPSDVSLNFWKSSWALPASGAT